MDIDSSFDVIRKKQHLIYKLLRYYRYYVFTTFCDHL